MSNKQFGTRWENDPSTDIVRLAKAYSHARKTSKTLFIPKHSVLNKGGLRTFNFNNERAIQDNDPEISLTQLSDTLIWYLADKMGQKLCSQGKYKPDELVLQIDNAYAQIDSGQHAPAPLNYYRYVLETRYWKKVTLLDWGSKPSPVSELLLKRYPKIRKIEGDIAESWATLINASNVVIGASDLAQALCFTKSDSKSHRKRVWVPSYAKRPDFYGSNTLEINPVEIRSYFASRAWWSSNRQRDKLLDCPTSHIRDHTCWKFTETERCRSFEFCQSCRDTGAEGKLWRQLIQQRFDVPERDWDCPHGWRWGGKPGFILGLKKTLRIGTVIKNTTTALGVKPCVECEERGEKLDGNRY